MDEMKITSGFTKGIITIIITKKIRQKLGIDPEIMFQSPIEMKIDETTAHIHLDVSINLKKDDLQKLLKDLV